MKILSESINWKHLKATRLILIFWKTVFKRVFLWFLVYQLLWSDDLNLMQFCYSVGKGIVSLKTTCINAHFSRQNMKSTLG